MIGFVDAVKLFFNRYADFSGRWIYLGLVIASLIPIISIIASIAQIVIACIPGTQGENKYGADPYGHGMDVFN